MMPIYPTLALCSAAAVLALELFVWRTGLLRTKAYWLAMAIVFAFMIPVDGWLTKLSDPIVFYEPADVSGWRPVWDILAEEFAYAFAMLTLVLLCWERSDPKHVRSDPKHVRSDPKHVRSDPRQSGS